MSLRKKIFGLALAASIFGASSLTAFAATEADIVKALKDAKVSETYIIKAENYLKTVELNETQISAINTEIKKAGDVISKENVADATKLSQAGKEAVLKAVEAAAASANLNVSIKKNATGVNEISLTSADGQEVLRVAANETSMKKTGSASTVLFLAGGLMIIAAAGSIFVTKKSLA